MWLTIFCLLLGAFWLAVFVTAFCPLRAYRRRREEESREER